MKVFHAGGLDFSINPMTFGIERVVMSGDASSFCFVKGKCFGLPYGNNFLSEKYLSREDALRAEFLYFSDVTATLTLDEHEGRARFRYTFRNDGKKPVSLEEGELGVYFPFNDTLDIPRVTLKRRVHSFVRTDGSVTYIRTIRASGETPALALIMTRGECTSYKTELNAFRPGSGNISLSVPAITLAPSESYEWEFVLVPYTDEADFIRVVRELGVLWATADNLTLHAGEPLVLRSETAETLTANGVDYPFLGGVCSIPVEGEGAHDFSITRGDKHATVRCFVLSDELMERRIECLLSRLRDEAGYFSKYDHTAGKRLPLKYPALTEAELAPITYLLRAARKGFVDLSAVTPLAEKYAEDLLETRLPKRASEADVLSRVLFAYEMSRTYPDREELLLWSAVTLRDLFLTAVPTLPTIVTEVASALTEAGKEAVASDLIEAVRSAADKLIAAGNRCADAGYSPLAECGALSLLSAAYTLTKSDYYLTNASEHLATMDATAAPSLSYRTNGVPVLLGRDDSHSLTYEMAPYVDAVHFAVAYRDFARASRSAEYRAKARGIIDALCTLFDAKGDARRGSPLPAEVNDRSTERACGISYGEDIILYYNELPFEGKKAII